MTILSIARGLDIAESPYSKQEDDNDDKKDHDVSQMV